MPEEYLKAIPKVYGLCDWDNRTLYAPSQGAELEDLDTVVHEFCHAFFPDVTEEVVTLFGNELSSLLWRMGYRNQGQPQVSR